MSLADDVVARIDRDALVAFALEVCNIDSSVGHEKEVAEHLHAWMTREGFRPRRVGALPDRYNLIGRLPGTGGGYSLLFNGHMDTLGARGFDWVHRDPLNPEFHKAWIEGDLLVGDGIVNDKGPVTAFLMAAKAIKEAGVPLKGDLLLTTVVGETSGEPSDETPAAIAGSKDFGARYLVTHGGVADFALVAEGTGFARVWVEAGKIWFKITLLSDAPAFYTPYLPDRTTSAASPNMAVAVAPVIEAIEAWGADYQVRHTREYAGGTVIPKVMIGAVHAGAANRPIIAPQFATLYVDVRTVPGQDPMAVQAELAAVLRRVGIKFELDIYNFRRGYEAQGIEPLAEAVLRQHRTHFKAEPPAVNPPTSSMWRDSNIFNEVGIPAMSYGPRAAQHQYKRALTIDSLYQAACMYARIAIDVCSQDKPGA